VSEPTADSRSPLTRRCSNCLDRGSQNPARSSQIRPDIAFAPRFFRFVRRELRRQSALGSIGLGSRSKVWTGRPKLGRHALSGPSLALTAAATSTLIAAPRFTADRREQAG